MPKNKPSNGTVSHRTPSRFTLPGLSAKDGTKIAEILQERLVGLVDLSLVLKHVHWNVVGPAFIGVHTMLDPQVAAVRLMADSTAERIAALGTSPDGRSGTLVATRTWGDYSLERALVPAHLGALDVVYRGLIAGHRTAIDELDDLDPVTQDLLIEQTAQLEQFQWFVRAHLETGDGHLLTNGSASEREAADAGQGA